MIEREAVIEIQIGFSPCRSTLSGPTPTPPLAPDAPNISSKVSGKR